MQNSPYINLPTRVAITLSECADYICTLDQLYQPNSNNLVLYTFPPSNLSNLPSVHLTGCYSTCLVIHSFSSQLPALVSDWPVLAGCKSNRKPLARPKNGCKCSSLSQWEELWVAVQMAWTEIPSDRMPHW